MDGADVGQLVFPKGQHRLERFRSRDHKLLWSIVTHDCVVGRFASEHNSQFVHRSSKTFKEIVDQRPRGSNQQRTETFPTTGAKSFANRRDHCARQLA